MSESKRSPVKRIAIIGAVAVVAIVLVISAAGLSVLFFLPDSPSQRSVSRDSAGDNTRARRAQDGRGLASMADAKPQGIPVAQGEDVQMVDIVTNPRIISFDNPGESQQLTVQGFYSDGSVGELADLQGAQPFFAASEPGIVQVDSAGVVSGLEIGGADIVVSYGEHDTEVPVLVWGPVRHVPAPDLSKLVEVSDDGTAVLVNRVLVDLEPGYGDGDAEDLAAMINGQVIFQYLSFPGYVLEFESSSLADLESVLTVLHSDSRVASAYPDQTVSVSQGPTPTPVAESAYYAAKGFNAVQMFEAWKYLNHSQTNPGSSYKSVVIVVIDTYFPTKSKAIGKVQGRNSYYHDDFDYSRIRAINSTDSLSSDHGIRVASILVAKNEHLPKSGDGLSGVVTSVDGIDYQLEFRGYDLPWYGSLLERHEFGFFLSQISNGLDDLYKYSDQIDVVNISMERSCTSFWCDADGTWSSLMRNMPNTTFVVAAGNEDDDVVEKNIIPASFTVDRGDRKAVPNVITVGGTEDENEGRFDNIQNRLVYGRHPESNYGEAITISAPFVVKAVYLEDRHPQYGNVKGTSFSAPLVTGTVALMKALDPRLTPEEIKEILQETGADTDWCRPSVTHCTPDDSIKMLDAEAAVKEVLNRLPKRTPTPEPTATYGPDATRVAEFRATMTAMTPTPTALLTPDSLVQYNDEENAYTIGVPKDWIIHPEEDGAIFVHPDFETDFRESPRKYGYYLAGGIGAFVGARVYDGTGVRDAEGVRSGEVEVLEITDSHNGVQYIEYTYYDDSCASDRQGVIKEIISPDESPSNGYFFVNAFACQKRFHEYEDLLWDIVESFQPNPANNSTSPASGGISLDQYGQWLNIQVPGIEAPLVQQILHNDFSPYFRPELKKMVGSEMIMLSWMLQFDIAHAPRDFQLPGYVRWVDVTDPNNHVVLSGAEHTNHHRTGIAGMRSVALYYTYFARRGTEERGFWKPGHYQVQLVSHNGEVLLYRNFEVT